MHKSVFVYADVYKYTYATDALGFKYIFDYAEQTNQPCVISFSEGSQQDFYGYDVLYYEMLGELVGPGRILVASAGNEGRKLSYLRKERGREKAGTLCGTRASALRSRQQAMRHSRCGRRFTARKWLPSTFRRIG